MSPLAAALICCAAVLAVFAVVAWTTVIDRRAARRIPADYDSEGA